MKVLYNIIYGIAFSYAVLPLPVLYVFSDILFLIIYHVFRYRRMITRRNLMDVFPGRSIEEMDKMEKAFYHHFCDYIFETIKLLHISDREMMRRFKFSNPEVINEPIKNGRSFLMMLGHYGNWEWVTSIPLWVTETDNLEIGQIYRPLKNKAFDLFMFNLRKRFSTTGIAKSETLRTIVKTRNAGRQFLIGFMSDQKPSRNNMHYWTGFLNQETSVLTGSERIARQTGAGVVYLDIRKVKRGFYEAEIKLITSNASETEEFEITEKYIRLMEKTILRDPALWLWTHNRWKYKKGKVV